MSSPSKDIIATYGLTPRDVDIAIKALITMIDGNLKPDYDKLAKLAGFKDGVAANKGWWATRKKIMSAKGANGDDDADDADNDNDDITSAPASTPKRKRKNADTAAAAASSPAPKRGRGRPKKNVAPPTAPAATAQEGGAEVDGQAGVDMVEGEA
ncbi:hypothetical protein VMCG_08831 [Cytospora schulzeri]|uniref:Uncharacterized protein n=1 Tax=Cytospora schulzeri TaxID=448051 RepID=A0A423VRX3_9PEZI|nr:hypothetical protein VMCG_08831 [Valsa malicola]